LKRLLKELGCDLRNKEILNKDILSWRLLKIFSYFILLLITLSTCSKQPEYQLKIETINGVKVITNPAYPREGKISCQLVEELSIGIEEGDENYILNRPGDLKVSDYGTIYILDWGDVNIKVYNKNGRYVRTIGRKGQGPGEFDTPCEFDIGSDGINRNAQKPIRLP